jgi:hypothetical protein
MFLSAVRSLLRAEGFSCSLGSLDEGLGIGKLQFFILKNINFFLAVQNIFPIFRHQNFGSGSGFALA